jgi:hypothetical protein
MQNVQQIETTIGEDDGFAFLFPACALGDKLGARVEASHGLQCNSLIRRCFLFAMAGARKSGADTFVCRAEPHLGALGPL